MAIKRNMLPLVLVAYGAFAGFLLISELRLPWQAWHTPSDRPSAAAALFGQSFSMNAREAALMNCDRALGEPFASLQAGAVRQASATRCLDLAQQILDDAPSLSFAHYVAALAAHHLGDPARRRRHLQHSQEFGAFEGWLAERRFVLSANLAAGTPDPGLHHDIDTLLTTQTGAALLARYFRSKPELRETITLAAERAGRANQQRLLNLIGRLESGA